MAEDTFALIVQGLARDLHAPWSSGLGIMLLLAWFGTVNLVTIYLFWLDKRRAVAAGASDRSQGSSDRRRNPVRGARVRSPYAPSRIPERTLLLLALAGGSPGAFHARARFRHKTRKQPFVNNLRLIAALQVGLLLGLGWLFVSGRV